MLWPLAAAAITVALMGLTATAMLRIPQRYTGLTGNLQPVIIGVACYAASSKYIEVADAIVGKIQQSL